MFTTTMMLMMMMFLFKFISFDWIFVVASTSSGHRTERNIAAIQLLLSALFCTIYCHYSSGSNSPFYLLTQMRYLVHEFKFENKKSERKKQKKKTLTDKQGTMQPTTIPSGVGKKGEWQKNANRRRIGNNNNGFCASTSEPPSSLPS